VCIYIYIYIWHFTLSFKVMYLSAQEWSVQPEHLGSINEINKRCCC